MTGIGLVMLAVALEEPVPAATCTLCHAPPARRFEASAHGFILADATLPGCETCHGTGRVHAESDGDPQWILNPRKLEAAELDLFCGVCHADVVVMRAQETGVHATSLSCASCHVIHNPHPERPITRGGRSLGAIEDTLLGREAAAILRAADVEGGLRAREATGWNPGIGMALRGALTAGVRFVDVSGDEDQYDQDVNLDGGFRLLEAELHGIADQADALVDRFDARASGIDDPVSIYEILLEKDRRWTFATGFRRQSWVYNASGDFHRPFDVRRDETTVDAAVNLRRNVRVYAAYAKLRRTGEFLGTRFIGGQVFPVDVPVEQQADSLRLGMTVDFGAFDVSVEERLRWWRNEDRRLLLRRDPGSPTGEEFLFFRSDRTDFTPQTIVRLHAAPWDGKVDAAVRAIYSHTDGEADVDSDQRSRAGGGAPVDETLDGRSDVRRNDRAIEASVTVAVRDDLSLSATGAAAEITERGRIRIERTPTGSAPELVIDESTSVSKRLVKGSAEGVYRPVRGLHLRAGFEGELQDVRVDSQDEPRTVDSGGPLVGIHAQPWSRLSVDALYRRAETDDPFTVVGARSQDRLRTRLRFTAAEGLYVSPEWTRSTLRNRDSDARVDSDTIGASAGCDRWQDLSASLAYFYRSFRSRAESSFTRDGARVVEWIGFGNREHRVLLDASWQVAEPLALEGSYEIVLSDGDFPFRFQRWTVRPTYSLSWNWSVFLETSFVEFQERRSSLDDYDAYLILIGSRYRF